MKDEDNSTNSTKTTNINKEKFNTVTEPQISTASTESKESIIPSTDFIQFATIGTSTVPNNLSQIINNLTSTINSKQTSIDNLTTNLNTLTTTVKNLQTNQVPDLTIVSYTGSTIPTGWQVCDGGKLLFSNSQTAVTTSYKNSTNFTNLNKSGDTYLTPDLRGRFVLGVGTGTGLTTRTINSTGGEEKHKLTEGEMPKHKHYVFSSSGSEDNSATHLDWGRTAAHMKQWSASYWGYYISNAKNNTADLGPTSISGGDAPHENMPPFYVLTYIIKQPLNI